MNRALALIGPTLWATFAVAQEKTLAGTKKDIVLPSAGGSGPIVDFRGVFQLVVAVGIVLVLLKFGLPWIVKVFGAKNGATSGDQINVKGTVAFGAGTLGIVEVHGKSLLVSATQTSINLVCDLGSPTAEQPAASQEPAFFEVLDQAANQTVARPVQNQAVVAAYGASEDTTQASRDDLQARLARLARLAE